MPDRIEVVCGKAPHDARADGHVARCLLPPHGPETRHAYQWVLWEDDPSATKGRTPDAAERAAGERDVNPLDLFGESHG